jgi:agmatinase
VTVSTTNQPERLLGECAPGLHDMSAVVLPFPYEGTVSYGKGAARGPEVILETLATQVEYYDTELRCSPCTQFGLFTLPCKPIIGSPEEVHERIFSMTRDTCRGKACLSPTGCMPFFIGLGGEHSVTYPFVKGLLEAEVLPKGTGILQIDAHADLRNAYLGNPLSHASVMRRLRDELGLQTVHVGIRAIGGDEPAYIEENDVPVFFAPFEEKQIAHILKELPENVFVTFDVDALDPSIMPSTGTPVPGGLLWYDALKLLRAVFESKNVPAMDIVELAPIEGPVLSGVEGLHAPNFLAAQLLYKAISYRFCLS